MRSRPRWLRLRGDALKTIEYLTDPVYAPLFWPGVAAALLVAVLCAPLSPLVVLKKMAFIGQGVSHAAFGGVGLVLYLGALAGSGGWGGWQQVAVLVFAAGAGLGISVLSRRQGTDTAIGIVLAVCMAAGFELYRLAAGIAASDARVPSPPGIEDVLFGSVLNVTVGGAIGTGVASIVVLGVLWWVRRPLIAWAFDEATAGSLGIRGERMRSLLLLMLSVAVVATMQIAGVVLATAMLIIPGVIGLGLGRSVHRAVAWSVASAVVGVAVGLVVTFEFGVQPGPSVVLALVAMMLVSRAFRRG